MMRSLFSGVAGLKNHQTRMDVIGNNIANVNTIGYKASRVTFEDMLSQTLQGASSAGNGQGGTNPMQVGLGSSVASIDTIFTDGSTQSTGKQTDMAISGNGFFILQAGSNEVYTRAGDFDFDEVGNLVVPGSGYRVMGWNVDSSGAINTGGSLSPIVISPTKVMPPKATTSIDYSGNLTGSTTAGVGTTAQTSIDTYDSLGEKHKVTQNYLKTGDNTWLFSTSAANGNITAGKYGIIKFKADGTVESVKDITIPTGTQTTALSFSSMQLNNTASSLNTITFNAVDSSGVSQAYTMEISNDTPYDAGTTDGQWSYTIKDSSGASVGTGTITCDKTSASYTISQTTPFAISGNNVTLSVGTSVAPATSTVVSYSQNGVASSIPTSAVDFSAVKLNNTSESTGTTYFTAVDSDGALHSYKMTLTNTTPYDSAGSTNGVWGYTISDASDTTNASLGSGTVTYDGTAYAFSPASVTLNGNSVALSVSSSSAPTAGTTSLTASLPYTVGTSLSDLAITPTNSSAAMTISRSSMNNITQYGGSDSSTVTAIDQNGYTAGTLQKKTVDSSGTITGTFSNGETMKLAQVALATFSNPGGLTKVGDSLYERSNNSGEPQRGVAGDGGRGSIAASSLEMSNVDLSQEFSDMIVTQRGFQANSKIITTSDEMLEILANLKR